MTEEEWKVRKENVALRKTVLQLQFNEVMREDEALGKEWQPTVDPPKLAAVGE